MSFTNRLKKSFTFISLILTSYSLTACANQGNQKQVSIDGAAVGFPISLAVAEEYHKQNENAVVSVASSGTGGGVSKFCAGEIDIVAASRTIKDEEVAKCKKKNIEFIELPIALDGIAVIVNRQNDFAKCLTIAELKKMWSSKSNGKVLSWNQINPKFPNEKMKLYAPASDTGTFDYFTQAITGKAKNSRTDYNPSHNQNNLVQGVAGEKYALGYVGISYYIQNQDQLNLVAVESLTGKCEKPVPVDNVVKNIYTPLSRPLFIYVSKKALDKKPSVKEFVNFYLENSWKWVDSVGYVALPDDAYVKVKQKLATGETGTKFKKAKPGQPITNFI
ncbi:PstS family phosphate ABC transporter substrate-binding protein [Scytonema hofmannii FACHB-248]|uniref:Phosphate-binding protein n=1 Tax=Scytonema hofmannii FACHB-248 TaxID=1842502 RepID=A0ABR8GR64_9CYAN|nr:MULTISPECIES: PstS family phosphate ABC transporter substrate-binding protein [Nostocales]MBD2605436.1 PstS family phosphate ABC transporter substrate-binding protein [Scytonema hofmannii FACHB-248]